MARAKTAKGAATSADAAIDYGPLAGWIGFHLRIAQAASFAAFAREAKDVDLSPGRFALLTLIGNNPGLGQTALSRADGRDKSTLTPALDDLVKRRLVVRVRPREDRRAYRLSLSAAGEAALRQLTRCAKRHEADLDRIVGARDRARLLRVLRRIAAELDNDADYSVSKSSSLTPRPARKLSRAFSILRRKRGSFSSR
jgi:DNA-binding MarR family transcriptional regulator